MKKLFLLSLLTLATQISHTQTFSHDPFAELRPIIDEMAEKWIDTYIAPFDFAHNQRFAEQLSSSSADLGDIIASEPLFAKAISALFDGVNFILYIYVDQINGNIESRKLSSEAKKIHEEERDKKAFELAQYICAIYYEKLYSYLQKQTQA